MPDAERFELQAADGYRLGATLFEPAVPNGLALHVQAAAGVKQDYYAKFAAYLAERGFTVLTFDYRGVGRSAPARLRGMPARMRDWAMLDAAAALGFLEQRHARRLAVGHSFGGQSFAVVPGAHGLRAVLAVGSQSGYWRHWQGGWRLGMWFLTHLLLPGASRAFGVFPGALMGQEDSLPAGVAREWASWCRHPQYLRGALQAHAEFDRFRAPYRLYAIEDDFYAPRRAAHALTELYPNARFDVRRVRPGELNVERIGHFGFFRSHFRDTLWREAADWLETQG